MATPSGKCCRHWLPGVAHGRRPDFESLVCHKCSWRNKHCSQPERNTLEFQTKKWKYSRSWWCVYIYIVCIYLVINKWYKVLLYIAIKLYIVYIYYIYNINIYIISIYIYSIYLRHPYTCRFWSLLVPPPRSVEEFHQEPVGEMDRPTSGWGSDDCGRAFPGKDSDIQGKRREKGWNYDWNLV
jgi:hypothetical protein